jgi:hypothetical protein
MVAAAARRGEDATCSTGREEVELLGLKYYSPGRVGRQHSDAHRCTCMVTWFDAHIRSMRLL